MFIQSDIRAIDPLALILSPEVYAKLHLPDPPPDQLIAAQVRQVAARLKGEERAQVAARAKTIAAYATALSNALSS